MAEFFELLISGAALEAHESRFLLLIMRERALDETEALGVSDDIGPLNPFGEATHNARARFGTISFNFDSNHVVSRLAYEIISGKKKTTHRHLGRCGGSWVPGVV